MKLFIFIVLLSFFTLSVFAETGKTIGENKTIIETKQINEDKKTDNLKKKDTWALDYLKDRKDRITDKLWLDKETKIEKKIKINWENIVEKKLEKEILENENTKNDKLINELENDLIDKYNEVEKLKKQLLIKKNDKEIIELKKEKIILQKEITNLKNAINNSKIQKKITDTRLQELIFDLGELNIYKAKYEEEYKKEIEENKNIIFKNIVYYLLYLSIFIIIHIILKVFKIKYEKENKQERLNKISIAVIFLYIAFIFWTLIYLVVLKPEIALIFVIIGSWILVSIRLVLSSFFASFWTSLNYTLWEVIKVWDTIWKIKEKKLLSLIISEMDENYNITWNNLKIPNYQLLETNVIKIKNPNVKTEELKLTIDVRKLKKWLENFIREVDNILYKKDFEICDVKNKKRYFLTINWNKINEFELLFKYKKKKGDEVNLEIIQKLIELSTKEEEKK